jgi:hypothetical protein
LRDFDPVFVGSGSSARITAPQQQWPVHLDQQTLVVRPLHFWLVPIIAKVFSTDDKKFSGL